jgi:hypothetical protein
MLNGDENVTYDLRAIVRQEDVSEHTPAAESQIQHERVQPSVATGRITGKLEVIGVARIVSRWPTIHPSERWSEGRPIRELWISTQHYDVFVSDGRRRVLPR